MSDDLAPIIIKKVKKGGHDHHGGAWKVAYADFVTAMMAFFLLLWLLNVTTAEQKQAIAFYFDPFSVSDSSSGSGGVLGGQSMIEPGASISSTTAPGLETAIPTTTNSGDDRGNDASIERDIARDGGFSDLDGGELLTPEEVRVFDTVAQQFFASLEQQGLLDQAQNNVIVERTSEGLQIQLIDAEGRPMFAPGSANVLPFAQDLLRGVVRAVASLDNMIDISGHTDASQLQRRGGEAFDNWDLSSARANAGRRVMLEAGLDADRLSRVVGKADSDLLFPSDPLNPGNRRLSILVLKEPPPEEESSRQAEIRRNDPNYQRIVPVPEAPVPLPNSNSDLIRSLSPEDLIDPDSYNR